MINIKLQINIDKCKFNIIKTKYLGLIIKLGGILINKKKWKQFCNSSDQK